MRIKEGPAEHAVHLHLPRDDVRVGPRRVQRRRRLLAAQPRVLAKPLSNLAVHVPVEVTGVG